jgi:hypothetical protein
MHELRSMRHPPGVLAQVSRSNATAAERRGYPRHAVWFPVQVDGEDLGIAVGATKDASATGLALEANGGFTIGAPVRLTFRVSTHEPLRHVDATIVRCHREPMAEWPWRLAVEFEDPLPHIEPDLRREAT